MSNRTYRYFGGTPLFAFGHGLSYTRFAYRDARLNARKISANGTLALTLRLANTGRRDGDEVVQVYFRHVKSAEPQPRSGAVRFRARLCAARQKPRKSRWKFRRNDSVIGTRSGSSMSWSRVITNCWWARRRMTFACGCRSRWLRRETSRRRNGLATKRREGSQKLFVPSCAFLWPNQLVAHLVRLHDRRVLRDHVRHFPVRHLSGAQVTQKIFRHLRRNALRGRCRISPARSPAMPGHRAGNRRPGYFLCNASMAFLEHAFKRIVVARLAVSRHRARV